MDGLLPTDGCGIIGILTHDWRMLFLLWHQGALRVPVATARLVCMVHWHYFHSLAFFPNAKAPICLIFSSINLLVWTPLWQVPSTAVRNRRWQTERENQINLLFCAADPWIQFVCWGQNINTNTIASMRSFLACHTQMATFSIMPPVLFLEQTIQAAQHLHQSPQPIFHQQFYLIFFFQQSNKQQNHRVTR